MVRSLTRYTQAWFLQFKLFSDDECYNDEWAECVGMDLSYSSTLEVEFLCALDWRCHVTREEFITVLNAFELQLALTNAAKGGTFTYNTARNVDIMGKFLHIRLQ